MQRPLGAQISHMLKDRGVDTIFGIPGVHNVEMYRGIEEAGITHILARHEQGAGFMADGYARATGKPGVAYVITGPGVCNIMTPMGQAYSDSVPLLVISSCLERKDLKMGRGRLHEMKDQEAAAATVCDWSVTALDADAAYHWIDRALAEFASARPRSKHVQVPIDVLGEMAKAAPPVAAVPSGCFAEVPGSAVADVAAQLRKAKRPLMILGGGAVGASEGIRALADRFGIASFTTYAGRGIFPPDAPLSFGSYLARPESLEPIGQADLVLVIGSELSETDLWRDRLGATGTVVRIDRDMDSLTDRHPADIAIQADAGACVDAILAATEGHQAKSHWTAEAVAAARKNFRRSTDADRPGIADIVDAVMAATPDETMVFSDMTQFAYVGKETVDIARPGLWHHPFGFGTLGYALPAAIGGKIGRPDQPVLAIAGDYGFQYTLQELGVAVELGLSLPILLWDNAKLLEIEASMVASQIAPNAVVARNPDFVKLAEAYGAAAAAPESITALQSALGEAFKRAGPTLIRITPDLS